MSQSTDPRPETWHAPGAVSMADPQEPTTGDQPVTPSYPAGPGTAPPTTPRPPQAWGSPSQGYGTTGYGATGYGNAGYGAPAGNPGYGSGGYGSTPPWQSTTPPLTGQPAPQAPGQQPPQGPYAAPPAAPRPERKRPGWGGVLAVGAGAAVLASALTAGTMHVVNDSSTTTSAATASSSNGQSAPPLVTSSSTVPNWGAVAAAVEPSVVSVRVEVGTSGGEGSGILLDTAGRILTNNHVVSEGTGTPTITVVLADGRAYPASIVGTDPSTDLAVIKLRSTVSGLKPATFGDSSKVAIGDPVMALGNPLGLSDTVTTGIVSAVNRPVNTGGSSGSGSPFGQATTEPVVTNAIQTDAAINPGNSGGALVDSGGRVIGITSSIASLSSGGSGQSGSIGLGFAIPVNEAKSVADELVATGKVQHAYLGVSLDDNSVTIGGAGREAAIVKSVGSGTPAQKAGLQSGDAVIAINGQRVDSQDSLVGTIRASKPGAKVTLTLVRDGKQQDISVTLGTRPATSG